MGPNAADSVMMWGNYSGFPTQTITALQGITQKCSTKYIQGCGLTRNEAFESRLSELRDPLGNKGLQATYWNNIQMEGTPATVTRIEGPVRLNNGGNTVFAPGVNLEHFSARYDATFIPTRDETVSFELSGDDRFRLLINADTVINQWSARQRIHSGRKEVTVKAGQHYRIQIDYMKEEGYAALNFDIRCKVNPTPEQLLAQIGEAETVIFVGGISPSLEGEEMRVSEPGFRGGDRESIELPQAQRDILALLHKAGKKVVFVNCSGSAMGLVPELESCDAILQWWYAGEQGGKALAEVLFGDKNPSGKLPITFYKSANDLPDFLDYTMANRTYRYFQGEPLFPFGYGLSYTTFQVSNLRADKKEMTADDQLTITADVKNIGSMAGAEVLQLYISDTKSSQPRPVKELKGFKKVYLEPGETQQVSFTIDRSALSFYDE